MAFDRQTIAPFVTGMPIPGLSVEALAQNARTSDLISRRGRTAWTDYVSRRGEFYEDYGANPVDLGRAAFQFAAGMTALSIQILGAGAASSGGVWSGVHTASIYLDGVLAATGALAVGYTTINVAISGLGLTVDQIVEVTVQVGWSVTIGAYRWADAYVTPVGGALGSYPGVPAFGNPTRANLEQLRTTDAWLWSKLALADRPAFTTMFWQRGRENVGYKGLWTGSVARAGGDSLLVISVDYWILTNQAERIEVLADPTGAGTFSSLVTSPSFAAGDTGTWTTTVDVSGWPDDTPRMVYLRTYVSTGAAGGSSQVLGSFFNVAALFTVWPSITPNASPAATGAAESMTWTTLQSRLTTIATSINDTWLRVGNNADVWNRQRCFRQPPILDAGERAYFAHESVARGFRSGAALWIRGKNVSIGWGGFAQSFTLAGDQHPATIATKQVISSDQVQTVRVPFASLDGLFAGMQYMVTGDELIYVAEELT